jgi:hypothetical protein
MQAIQILEAIQNLAKSDEYAIRNSWVGIRGTYRDEPVEIGAKLRKSFKWVDGNKTSKKLRGTCTVGITQCAEDVDADNIKAIEKALKKVTQYGNDKFILVYGTSGECGNDDFSNEYVIHNAKVLAILTK